METLTIVILILIAILLIGLGYLFYQHRRNHEIYAIRIKWIDTVDARYHRYSYDYMFEPSKANWFGLKYPKDSDYK